MQLSHFAEKGKYIDLASKQGFTGTVDKNAPFIILDEPTAALDPIAEYEVYSKFNEIVQDKTAIYISHRLSSCRFCDVIAVFDGGQIVQRGVHDRLLQDTQGKYYELWNAQAQYYTQVYSIHLRECVGIIKLVQDIINCNTERVSIRLILYG